MSSVTGESRKIVTVLFSDVTGSTGIGHELDPESLRHLMARYFGEMEAVLRRHGGSVEKFVGDAVMAVFGIPRSHEDDAVRAVRAALEMRAALDGLNDEFHRTWGVSLTTRTGVNTGEVIAGDPDRGQSFVTGDAVNVAARLEQTARPGEILIGESTYRLIRDSAAAEPIGPISLRGKPEPVDAWRLIDVAPGAPTWTRRLDSPIVGRDGELALLDKAFELTAANSSCRVITILGAAGVGKSRLTAEFIEKVAGRAAVVQGRCLPYGEGITFWPIREVILDAAAIGERDAPGDAGNKVQRLLSPGSGSDVVAGRLTALLGVGDAAPGIQQTFWAVRKLFESLGAERPLVVVFDDIQWGESTFLDLVEYLADWIRTVPVFVLAQARPDLLEIRPTWMQGKDNATTLPLHPLTETETAALIGNLTGRAELPEEARGRITEVAEGNPLFVEEILRMLVDEGLLRAENGGWTTSGDLSSITIPPTIHALLATRLDRLDPEERAVLERAAVVGRVFWWAALSELSSDALRPRLGHHLQSLTRKELIRPDYAAVEQDAFRFAHILIRDAAYQEIPKAGRAELHERLAWWIERGEEERPAEVEEIIGYHLETAYRALAELGAVSDRVAAVGRSAAERLGAAGRRAFVREDMPAAVSLLSRAVALVPEEDPVRPELLPHLAFALMETGDFERLQAVVTEAGEAAKAFGDDRLRAHAAILELWIRLFTNPEGWAEEAEREASAALDTFRDLEDELGLTRAWSLLGLVHITKARYGPAERAWQEAAAHARLAGDRRAELEAFSWILASVWAGPHDAEAGLERCAEVIERAGGDPKATSTALMVSAVLQAGLGRLEEARANIARARGFLEEVALTVWMAGPLAQMAGLVELLAGEPKAAEHEFRRGFDTLQEIGEASFLATVAALLGETLYLQGRYEDAADVAKISEESAGAEDAYSQVLWRVVVAKVRARTGAEEAEAPAREAVSIAEHTDSPELRAISRPARWMTIDRNPGTRGRTPPSTHPASDAWAGRRRAACRTGPNCG